MTLFVVNSNAQRIVEKLPDNSYIVEIEGVEYRALPPNTMKEVLKLKESYKLALSEIKDITTSFDSYKVVSEKLIDSIRESYKLELDKANYNAGFYKTQFEEEKKFRDKYANYLSKCTKIILFRVCFF